VGICAGFVFLFNFNSITIMKTLTFNKPTVVETTIPYPVVTFVPEKVNVFLDGTSWDKMLYVPLLDGLHRREYNKTTSVPYNIINNIIFDVVSKLGVRFVEGYYDSYAYTGKMLGMSELPELADSNVVDQHAKLLQLFRV
jgi:hypothetical protein